MGTGIALIVILLVLGVALWWGNRRAREVQEDTADLEGYKPLKFNRIIPRMPWK